MNKENILAEIIALLSRASDEKKIEVLKVLNDEDIPQKNSFPVFYTLKEAGKKIGVSYSSIYKLCEKKAIKTVNLTLTNTRYISDDDLREYLSKILKKAGVKRRSKLNMYKEELVKDRDR